MARVRKSALAFLTAAVALSAAALSRAAGVEGFYRMPTIRGEQVVFASEGDLWSVSLNGGRAIRLTTHPANEVLPFLSPDGKLIAFTADYEGSANVYIMPAEGGEPRRLTYIPRALCAGWSNDGKSVYFRLRNAGRDSEEFTYSVPLDGGEPTKLPLGTAAAVSYSPDGTMVAFNRWLFPSNWRNYGGGTAPQIWVEDIAAKTFKHLSPVKGVNSQPMWVNGRIFFTAPLKGTLNIYSMLPDGSDLKAVTNHLDFDVRLPQTDGKSIIYSCGADLYVLDAAGGQERKVNIQLVTDRIRSKARAEDAGKTIDGFDLSHDGKRLVISSRGNIWNAPLKTGNRVIEVAGDSATRERAPAFSPDGTQVVAITDATGEQELALFDAAGKAAPKSLTHEGLGWLFQPQFSPDGKHVVYADLTMALRVVDIDTGKSTTIRTSEVGEITQYAFSPDGQWIAYTEQLENQKSTIYLAKIDGSVIKPLGEGFTADFAPAFDPEGKYLYFLSGRHVAPTLDETDFNFAVNKTTTVCMVLLAADTKSPLLPEDLTDAKDDGDKDDAKDGDKKDKVDAASKPATTTSSTSKPAAPKKPKPTKVDLDGIERRQVELPIPADVLSSLGVAAGGKVFFTVQGLPRPGGEGSAGGELKVFDLKSKKTESVIEGVKGFTISGDGKRIAWHKDSAIYVADASSAVGGKTEEKVTSKELPLVVDTVKEWKQIFADAWRLQRDFFWTANMNGVDWKAAKYKYEQLLPRVGHRNELNELINQMQGELGTGHEYISGGDLNFQPPSPIVVGYLGADVEPDSATGLHKITRIYRPETWETEVAAPLAAPHVKVAEGDFLLAINGKPVAANESIYQYLQNQAGTQVVLTVATKADKSDAHDVQIATLRDEFQLKYHDLVRRNRQWVAEKSGGKIGYFHLPDMMNDGITRFVEGFFAQFNKPALLIDARDNHGGYASQLLLARLGRKNISYDRPRRGAMSGYPSATHIGPKAVLINQHAGSDGDIFPSTFRAMGLGPLIGERTWGGVIGIRSDKPFVDGGMSTQPEFAWWSPDNAWAIENHGVDPDIEVNYSPEDYLNGTDSQLAKGVEELLAELAKNPPQRATRPADPERTTPPGQ